MKIKDLIKDIDCESLNLDLDLDVTSISLKDSECKLNSAYFAIKGRSSDGKNYVKNAVNNGAKVIITEEFVNNCSVGQIKVSNVRETLNRMCAIFYDNPQKKIKKIAVIGTNGKTTVCELITKILNNSGISCGKIGTLGAEYGEKYIDTGFTTPDTPQLYAIMNDMVNKGMKVVCMELSAHAIYYNKADFKFDLSVFTNCTPEHLDFFESFEEYRETKLSAFTPKKTKIAVVNGDDLLGKQIACLRNRGVITYGIEDPADVFAVNFSEDENGMSFLINLFDSLYEISSSYFGKFNLYNFLAVSTVCALFGAKTEFIANELRNATPVRGRMEKISNKINVFIDYAHTPDGLKNALETLLKLKKENKLICVFGCGGNRDKSKREIMGKISAEYADFTIITSDNPRFEDEQSIISQIERGTRSKSKNYITIRNREDAINYAVQMANSGDYVLIAGKGAEEYQEQMGVKRKFSDKEIAQKAIRNKYEQL